MDFEEKVALAVTNLAKIEDVNAEQAEKLVRAGFLTVEGILAADLSDIEAIEGLDAESAQALHAAAEAAYEKEHGKIQDV